MKMYSPTLIFCLKLVDEEESIVGIQIKEELCNLFI